MAPHAQRFEAEIYRGHSDRAVHVPFAPEVVWGIAPRRIGYRKHMGHAVRATVDGHPFEGWIWPYVRKFVLVIPDPVLDAASLDAGDVVELRVEPHPEPERVPPFRPGG
jgi:hypothetical protein